MQRIAPTDGASPPDKDPRRVPWYAPDASQLRALRALAPYVWPKDRPDLKRTVLVSLLLVVAC